MSQHLERAAEMGFEDYNPAYVIRAVNDLQPLGKERALEEIREALERRTAKTYPYGMLWVLRVLFDVPETQGFPPVRLGTPTVQPPPDPARLPRFPIVIVRDVPLLVVQGYVLRGLAEPVDAHIEYYREHGMVRAGPLQPPAALDDVTDELRELWLAAYGEPPPERTLAAVREQLARTADTLE